MICTNKFLLPLFTFCLAAPLWGQTRLTIIDKVSGEPVPYVNICFGGKGKYTDESGAVSIPDTVSVVEISHISFEAQTVNLDTIEDGTIRLNPVVATLPPAIVLPKSYRIRKIGHFSDKSLSVIGGENGYTIAEYFNSRDFNRQPIIAGIIINMNSFFLKKTFTTTVGEEKFDNCVMHIAKIRVDIRSVNEKTGAPGESLMNGGIIYETKEKTNLTIHKLVNIPLEDPLVFPEGGAFVVIEWIVTDDVGEHDDVTPGIWCTQSQDNTTSWDKWPIGTQWKRINEGREEQSSRTFCIGLKLLE